MKNDKKNHFWGDYHIIKRILLFQRSFFRDNPRGKAAGVSAMMANTNISSSLAAAGDGALNWLDGATFDWRSKVSWLSAHNLIWEQETREPTLHYLVTIEFLSLLNFSKSRKIYSFFPACCLFPFLYYLHFTLSSSTEQSGSVLKLAQHSQEF